MFLQQKLISLNLVSLEPLELAECVGLGWIYVIPCPRTFLLDCHNSRGLDLDFPIISKTPLYQTQQGPSPALTPFLLASCAYFVGLE